MKVVFLCGSLEPGRDGVGDYTRRLSGELIRKGHLIKIIAINDHHISESLESIQFVDGISVNVLRLSGKETFKNRFNKVFQFIDQFEPEWLSLQFVPFSFHKKGLPWGLAKQLALLGNGRKWHIMFHELWVGMAKNDSLKLKILGRLQKHIIKKMIDKLVPKIINTQTRLYQAQLDIMGYESEILPLFGNIPNLYQSEEKRNGSINIAVFGGIHRGAKLENFINELPKANKYKFHFIGSNGAEQENWIVTLSKNNVDFQLHGWLGNEEISKILSKCHLGLTSTPYYLSEKSGSAAAMLEHNLIVFCIARKWTPRELKVELLTNDAIIKWKKNIDIKTFIGNKRYNSENKLELIAENFINRLKINQV